MAMSDADKQSRSSSLVTAYETQPDWSHELTAEIDDISAEFCDMWAESYAPCYFAWNLQFPKRNVRPEDLTLWATELEKRCGPYKSHCGPAYGLWDPRAPSPNMPGDQEDPSGMTASLDSPMLTGALVYGTPGLVTDAVRHALDEPRFEATWRLTDEGKKLPSDTKSLCKNVIECSKGYSERVPYYADVTRARELWWQGLKRTCHLPPECDRMVAVGSLGAVGVDAYAFSANQVEIMNETTAAIMLAVATRGEVTISQTPITPPTIGAPMTTWNQRKTLPITLDGKSTPYNLAITCTGDGNRWRELRVLNPERFGADGLPNSSYGPQGGPLKIPDQWGCGDMPMGLELPVATPIKIPIDNPVNKSPGWPSIILVGDEPPSADEETEVTPPAEEELEDEVTPPAEEELEEELEDVFQPPEDDLVEPPANTSDGKTNYTPYLIVGGALLAIGIGVVVMRSRK